MTSFFNTIFVSFLPDADNDAELFNLTRRVALALKDGLEDLFLYQSDLLENTPGDPDPEDEEFLEIGSTLAIQRFFVKKAGKFKIS